MNRTKKMPMPWLKDRLREIGKTAAGRARNLEIEGPRVYEMIAGRRNMQPHEIAGGAKYLEWPINEVIDRLPEGQRLLPAATEQEAAAQGPGLRVGALFAYLDHIEDD